MLFRSVIHHEIENDFDAAFMRFEDQLFNLSHRPENRIDFEEVGNIIAIIDFRRFEDRIQPNHIDAQILNIIQTVDNTANIPDTIPVGVLKTHRIHLIHNQSMPPLTHITHTKNLTFVMASFAGSFSLTREASHHYSLEQYLP